MLMLLRRNKKREEVLVPSCSSTAVRDFGSTVVEETLSDTECESECSSDNSSVQEQREKKSVVFKQEVHVRLIAGREELSSAEKDELWYSSADSKKMQDHNRTTLCFMNASTTIPPKYERKFCARGLEGRTRRALRTRVRLREAVRVSVLYEQKMQQSEGIHDPDAIAKASYTKSFLAIEESQEAAQHDEYEARQYCKPAEARMTKKDLSTLVLDQLDICRWAF